jgi:hypothetical protein
MLEETQMCIADCLGLQKTGAQSTNNKPCKFNIQTGAGIIISGFYNVSLKQTRGINDIYTNAFNLFMNISHR